MKKLALLIALSVTLITAALPALAQQPGCDPNVDYSSQGWSQFRARDYRAARASFTCGLQFDPDNARLYYGLAETHCRTGDVPNAIKYFTRSVELEPTYSMGWNTLGWAYYKSGNLSAAMDAVNQSIAMDPENPYPYNNRGLVYAKWGQLDAAQADFQRAIDLGMVRRWARTNLYNLTHYAQ